MIKKFLLIYLGLISCFLSKSFAYAAQPVDSAVPVAIDARLNSRETKQILTQAKVSKNDIRTYKKIFAAIDKNRITAAKEMIRKLDNDLQNVENG